MCCVQFPALKEIEKNLIYGRGNYETPSGKLQINWKKGVSSEHT